MTSSSKAHGRRAEIFLALALLLGVIGFGIGWATAYQRADQRDAISGEAQQLVECVNDPATILDDCDDQADEVERTIEEEDADPGPAGPAGPAGDDGTDGAPGPAPTDLQVDLAVRSYCANGRCDGADGRSVTPAQVATAVADYCTSNGECRGPSGADGADGVGQDGTDGQDGAQGPPPSVEQVAAAVASYCTDGACAGPAGTDGTDGADGTNGRGIRFVTCDPDTEQFVVTFTDDTVQSVDGSDCVAALLDPPAPQP